MFKLVIVHKGKIQKNIPLRHEAMIIGRKAESDIRLEEQQVSGRHAELLVKNSGVILRDLGSTNGTTINGSPVTEQKLQTGDQISIGTFKLIFVTEHGDSDDPDATVMLSSSYSGRNDGQSRKQSTMHIVVKLIVIVVVILFLIGWFTNVI